MIFIENLWRYKKKILNIILNKKISVKDKINFGSKNANNFFIKKVNKSKFYFEYGSGASTLYIDKMKKKYISIETDYNFYKFLLNKIYLKKSLKYFDIGVVGEFSYPIISKKKNIIKYIESINKFLKKKNHPDLILIDGRFRVACCLNILKFKKSLRQITLILDDYKKRDQYKILEKYFIIKKIGRFAILKPSNKKNLNKKILNKYYFKSS